MSRVLVIDDEELVRATIREMFEESGYEACEAADGEQGLRVVEESPMDLVIVDILMPKREGIETIIELQRRDPGMKIIAISGGGLLTSEHCLKMAEMAGAHRILSKPLTRDKIIATADELLRGAD